MTKVNRYNTLLSYEALQILLTFMNIKGIIGTIIVVVIVFGGWYFFGRAPEVEGVVKIGFIGPLTGDAASIGEPLRNAVAIAVDEINAKGDVQIEVIYEDGLCNANGGTNAAQKLINVDGVKYIIGGMCSGETLGAAPVAEQAGVVLFSPASGSPDITNAGDYIFRNFPSDSTSGSKMAEVAVERNLKNVALLTEVTDYAQALEGVFKQRFGELGGTIVADESFNSDTTDLRSQITKIKAANPKALYFIAQSPATAKIALQQIRELGLDVQILSNEFLAAPDVIAAAPSVIEGALYAEPAFDPEAPNSAAYLAKYLERYGGLTDALPPIYLATAYDAVYVVVEAIEKAGTDPEKAKNVLYQVRNRAGAAGSLSIDRNGDAELEYLVKTITNGKAVPVE